MDQYSVYEGQNDHEEALDGYISGPWFESDRLRIKSSAWWSSQEIVAKISIGTIIHYTLSKIRYVEDADAAIASAHHQFSLSDEEVSRLASLIQKLFSNESIVQYFKPPWSVKNEAAIIMKEGDVLRPDRFLFADEHSVVFDFKTGEPSSRHIEQVKHYMRVLKEMGYKDVQGRILYFSNMELVHVDL